MAGDGRQDELAEFAKANDLSFSGQMDQTMLDPAFFLFSQGLGRVTAFGQNRLEGEWKGTPLAAFDCSIEQGVEVAGIGGWVGADRATYSVAVAGAGGPWPYVYVEHPDVIRQLTEGFQRLAHLHNEHDEVECGAAAFDREFEVRSPEPETARKLFTHRVMDAMLAAGKGFAWEIASDAFIVYGARLSAQDLPRLLDAAAAFHKALGLMARPGERA